MSPPSEFDRCVQEDNKEKDMDKNKNKMDETEKTIFNAQFNKK